MIEHGIEEVVEYPTEVKPSDIIVEANDLVEASYKLGLNEQRLVLYMASKIRKGDCEFRTVRVSVKEFAETFNLDYRNIYRDIQKATESLTKKSITFKSKEKEGRYIHISWLASAEYNNGMLELEFAGKLKPYLLQLSENFTKYALGEFVHFTSVYSIRIYQMLKRYLNFRNGVKYYTLKEIREILGVEKKYPKYSNFKRRVIAPALEDIKNFSDIYVDMKEQKEGNKVVGIKFVVTEKVKEPVVEEVKVDSALLITVKTLVQTVVHDKIVEDHEAEILLKEAQNDISKIMQQVMNVQRSKGKIANVIGFIRQGIRDKYEVIDLEKEVVSSNPAKNYTDDSESEDLDYISRQTRNY